MVEEAVDGRKNLWNCNPPILKLPFRVPARQGKPPAMGGSCEPKGSPCMLAPLRGTSVLLQGKLQNY